MLNLIITILFITISSSSIAEEVCEAEGVPKFESGFEVMSDELAKDCSLESINKTYESGSNLRKFAKLEKKDLCKCLDGSKFMVAKVDNKRKKSFERGELDKTIADKMKEDFNNLASQFIMFENFSQTKTHLGNILDESEIKKAGGICNIQTLEDDIVKLEKNKNCKAPKGFFRDRLKTVFGNSSPENIWDVTKDKLSESDKNSCISKARYLDMRSSAGASDIGFDLLEKNSGIQAFRAKIDSMKTSEKNQVKDLLSYNVVFNMAYRDSTFFHEVKGRLAEIQKSGKGKYDLFQDPVLLQKAYTSMNRSCNLFSRAVKHYLCTDKNPTLHPSIMSAHLEDYFSKEKVSDAEKKANTDYFTWQYSCNPLGAEKIYRTGWDKFKGIFTESMPKDKKTPNEEAFERYVERSVMIKTVTKPTIDENNPQTDYAKFNKMFCDKDSLKINDSYAISQKMSSYIKSLQEKGVDISSVLGNKNLQKQLGLGIELEYSSVKFSTNNPNDSEKLPHISPEKWETVMAPELKKKGLSEDEIYQLYTLVEMQTNRVYTEMEDLKAKLVSSDPRFENYSLVQIKKHTEGFYGEMTPQEKKDAEIIQNRQIAQKYDARMDVGYSQKLLMGEATTTEVKNEAIAYNQNLGTFDNRYVTQTNETTQDTKHLASNNNTPSTPSEYKFGSGKNPNEGQDSYKPTNNIANNTKPSNQGVTTSISESKDVASSETVKSSSDSSTNNQIASNTPSTSSISSYTPSSPIPSASINDPFPGQDNKIVSNRPERKIASKEDYVPSDDDYVNPEIAELRKQVDEELKRARDYRDQLANNKNKPIQNNTASDNNQLPQFDNSQNHQFAYNNKTTPTNNYSSSPSGEDATLSDEVPTESDKLKENGKTSKSQAGSKYTQSSETSDSPDTSIEASAGGNLSPKSLGNIKSSMPDGFLNGEGTKETDDEIRKRLGLQEYQYPRYIPHKLMEIEEIKTPERLVMLMSLYGKEFKTIEFLKVSEDPNSALKETKYIIHTFDFRPEGKLEEYNEDLETPEKRANLARKFINLDNPESGHHAVEVARSTKEVKKGEITKTEADKLKPLTLKFDEAIKIYQERSGNLEKFYKKYEEVEGRIKQRKARKNK